MPDPACFLAAAALAAAATAAARQAAAPDASIRALDLKAGIYDVQAIRQESGHVVSVHWAEYL